MEFVFAYVLSGKEKTEFVDYLNLVVSSEVVFSEFSLAFCLAQAT
jgi:hypothetical protein